MLCDRWGMCYKNSQRVRPVFSRPFKTLRSTSRAASSGGGSGDCNPDSNGRRRRRGQLGDGKSQLAVGFLSKWQWPVWILASATLGARGPFLSSAETSCGVQQFLMNHGFSQVVFIAHLPSVCTEGPGQRDQARTRRKKNSQPGVKARRFRRAGMPS